MEGLKLAENTGLGSFAKPQATVSDGIATTKRVVVSNPTNKPILTWIASSVTFAQGEMSELFAKDYGSLTRPSQSHILKRWDDGSVAILQVKMPFFLQPNEVAIEEVGHRQAPIAFEFHPEVNTLINSGKLPFGLTVTATVNGEILTAAPFTGAWKFLRADGATIAIRYRSHFYGGMPLTERPLSCTAYIEAEYLNPIIKCTIVLGNDTLEKPVAGGINVTNFAVNCIKPGVIQNEQAFGTKSAVIADGQQLAFRYFFSCSNVPIFLDTLAAWSQAEIVGQQIYEQLQDSKALLTHADLPNQRFQASQVLAVHNQVEAENAGAVSGNAKSWLGFVNQNPPSTGDQPDFSATHPMTKCLQSYSARLFSRTYLGVMRECWRPSHYWETRNGTPEWASLVNYPTEFHWSGRPHWHPTWNPEYPVWQARGALDAGPFDGWGPADNQHQGNAHVRGIWELSGDYYLHDILFSYVSVMFWNWHTKWKNSIEAERGCRSQKESWALSEIFSHTPEGQALRSAVLEKGLVYDQAVTQNIAQWQSAGCAPFNACDPRVNNGSWCAPFPGNTIAVGWQTGFHMEWEWLRATPDLRYLDNVSHYFLADGTPKTYFPFPAAISNPNDYVTGGIGLAWWAGWVMLALKHPTHTGSAFILEKVKPMVDAAINNAPGYFSGNDRWKAWR